MPNKLIQDLCLKYDFTCHFNIILRVSHLSDWIFINLNKMEELGFIFYFFFYLLHWKAFSDIFKSIFVFFKAFFSFDWMSLSFRNRFQLFFVLFPRDLKLLESRIPDEPVRVCPRFVQNNFVWLKGFLWAIKHGLVGLVVKLINHYSQIRSFRIYVWHILLPIILI